MLIPIPPAFLVALASVVFAVFATAESNLTEPILARDTAPDSWRSIIRRGKQYQIERKGILTQGDNPSKQVMLTFDDGPFNYTRELVDHLNQENVKATFFVNGYNFGCIYDKESVKSIRHAYRSGHQICSHTWCHPHLTTLNDDQFRYQIRHLQKAFAKIIGAVPTCIRPPYGEVTDDQVRILNDEFNMQVITWNIDSTDSAAPEVDVDSVLEVYKSVDAPPNPIILNHDVKQATVQNVIPQAIPILRQKGFTDFVTVSQGLGFQPYKAQGPFSHRDETWNCQNNPAPPICPA